MPYLLLVVSKGNRWITTRERPAMWISIVYFVVIVNQLLHKQWLPVTKNVMVMMRRHCNAQLGSYKYVIDQIPKSENAPVPYLPMHHFGTEMCTFLFQSEWCIVGYVIDALWDLWFVISLPHWGPVTEIDVAIGPCSDFSLLQRQTTTQTNIEFISSVPQETEIRKFRIKIRQFSFQKCIW